MLVADAVAIATELAQILDKPLSLELLSGALRDTGQGSSIRDARARFHKISEIVRTHTQSLDSLANGLSTWKMLGEEQSDGWTRSMTEPARTDLIRLLADTRNNAIWARSSLDDLTPSLQGPSDEYGNPLPDAPEPNIQGYRDAVTVAAMALEAFNLSYQSLSAFIQAWRAFGAQGHDLHLVSFRFRGGAVTFAEASAWLSYLDALIRVAAATAGERVSAPAQITRIEFGSLHALLEVPEHVWNALERIIRGGTEFVQRGADTEGHKIRLEGERAKVAQQQMAGLRGLVDFYSHTRQLVKEGRLRDDEADDILHKARQIHDVERASLVRIEVAFDNQPVTLVQPAEEGRPRHQLPAPSSSGVLGDDEDGGDDGTRHSPQDQ